MKPKILFIEICNYKDYPIGGYLAFAKQMITAFGNSLALVGMSTDDTPVGVWTKKEINGQVFDYFSVCHATLSHRKSLIPGRLKAYLAVRKYRKKIMEREFDNVFIQTPEVLFALSKTPLKNLCTRIPGVENPMTISRYWYGKYFAKLFDRYFFRELKKAQVILATADQKAISGFIARGKNSLSKEHVIQFPTRVNTNIFRPMNQEEVRKELKLSRTAKIVATTGRLSTLKGWQLMLESFDAFRKVHNDSLFMFLGDGEERTKIENYLIQHSLTDHVLIVGRTEHERLSMYLNAADLYVMGSFVEGWSTSLVEAIACGKPVVCTNFSSASELVLDMNGFVMHTRDPFAFSNAMVEALKIPAKQLMVRSEEMKIYASSRLKEDILVHWRLS